MAYSDEQREFVYQVWAFSGNRNAEKTARLVHEHPDSGDLKLSDLESRTIRNWVKDQGWENRATEDIFSAAPHIRFRAQSALALASPEAAETLREAATMDCYVERSYILKDSDGNQFLETRREFDVNLYKVKVNAAQLVLDRTGFSPVGTRETGQLDAPPSVIEELADEIVNAKTAEDLAAAEQKLRERFGMGRVAIGIGQSHRSQDQRGWS